MVRKKLIIQHLNIQKRNRSRKIFFLENKKKEGEKESLTSSSASFSMAVNDSASARLSTAMAKNTFSRMSAVFHWSRNGLTIFFVFVFIALRDTFFAELEERKGYNYRI